MKKEQSETNKQLTQFEVLDNAITKNVKLISDSALAGFERAYKLGMAVEEIKNLITDDFMKPIMSLQNQALGFKTDQVYGLQDVKNCLIEAVLMGLEPTGNQFNIIAKKMYITLNGGRKLLRDRKKAGIVQSYKISSSIMDANILQPFVKVQSRVLWKQGDAEYTELLDFHIKSGVHGSGDALISKAERKSSIWLLRELDNVDYADGDVNDMEGKPSKLMVQGTIIKTQEEVDKNQRRESLMEHIEVCESIDELKKIKENPLWSEFENDTNVIEYCKQRQTQLTK